MSYIQEYFPPKATKHKWSPKSLNYSPWTCSFWNLWPASITCYVDQKDDGTFKWSVRIYNFQKEQINLSGVADDALKACLAAEKEAQKQKKKIFKPWMNEAIKAGWRTP